MPSISFDPSELQTIFVRVQRALMRSHDLMAQEVWGNIMQESPVDHGRLAGSWNLMKRGPLESVVMSNVEYAAVVNDGADPFTIYPKNAQALRFEIDGEVIFAKYVNHPGFEGDGYIDRAIEKAEQRQDEFVQIALDGEGL